MKEERSNDDSNIPSNIASSDSNITCFGSNISSNIASSGSNITCFGSNIPSLGSNIPSNIASSEPNIASSEPNIASSRLNIASSALNIASSQKTIIRCFVVVSSKKYRLDIAANVIRLKRRVGWEKLFRIESL